MKSTRSPSSIRSIRLPESLLRPLKTLLGFRPIPVPPHAFSVAPERLAYGRFVRGAGELELAAYREQELGPKLFQQGLLGGPLREPADFDAALAALLEGLDTPVHEASLVVPDTWLRVTFTEVGELPRNPATRTEVLRWKLKRLVPFRVEELRLGAVEVESLPDTEATEPHRMLLGFALDALLDQLEASFSRAGIRIGSITSASLALLGLLAEPGSDGLTALAVVEDGAYTLAFARHGEPVLHRYKGAAGATPEAARGGLVERDLKLTRSFLEEQLPSEPIGRILLVSPPEREPEWIEWLEAGLGQAVEPLNRRHLPLAESGMLATSGSLPPWRRLAPMLGAASQEVV